MSRSIRIPLRLLTLVLVALPCLLSACAILTVDVDVYKGPLMNEERVQMQQLVSIAEGAKPLLTHLRDDLEWRQDGLVPTKHYTWYKPGYIKSDRAPGLRCHYEWLRWFHSCADNGYKGFAHPLARRVNDILNWYEPESDIASVTEPSTPVESANPILDDLPSQDDLRGKIAKYRASKPTLNVRSHQDQIDQLEEAELDRSLEHKEELIKSLVQFGAKILFLANHEGLSAANETRGLIAGGVGSLSRSLFGDTVTENFSPMAWWDNIQGKGTLAARKRLQYVRILQAVGNSILLSANELREQQEARKGGNVRAKAELTALQETLVKDPFKVFANLVHDLEEESKGQDILEISLKDQLGKSNKEMNELEAGASAQESSTRWKASRDEATKQYDQLEGALNLIDSDKSEKMIIALGKLTGTPADVESAWSAILQQVPKVLLDERLSANAKQYLESIKDKVSLDDNAKSTYAKAWEAVKAYLVGQRTDLSTRKQEVKKLARLVVLFEEKSKNEQSKKKAEDKRKSLDTTAAQVKAEKGAVLDRLVKQSAFMSGRGVYLTLAMHFRDRMGAMGKTPDETAKIQIALDELNTRVAPPGLIIMTGQTDAKEVLDHEIAFLRQEHIQAVRDGGEDADAVKRALDALEAASQHRAGMVHLRPAAAYLRTSYPSTSLQDDPNLTWDNLLLQQGIRNIPFSSYVADLFDPEARHDRSISGDLDKQFWQNINRVRVSGAGSTNYVLAKDDVGNWYVKSYFGDTERIFESARKLGMYNLSSAIGTNVLSALKNGQTEKDGSTTPPQLTPLKRVFDKQHAAYSSKTTTDVTTLKELAEKDVLSVKIQEAWQSLPDLKGEEKTLKKLEEGLSAPNKKLKDRMGEIQGDVKTRDGVRVVQEIQAIRDFHTSVNSGI